MQEKRKYFRLKEEDEISFSVLPNYKSERMLTQNISTGGVRFISDNFISPQSVLKIEMAFNQAKKVINIIAVVKWIKSIYDDERYEVGAVFIDIDNEDLQFLNRYLNERA
jgi:hypothetical protein